MKKLIMFYSYGGSTEKIARQRAEETGAELYEIHYAKMQSVIGTYIAGCFNAMRRKTADIKPITAQLDDFEVITLMGPIWAGHPAPPMNNMINALPSGKTVELVLVSASGDSSETAERTKALVSARGCEVAEYTDIKTGKYKKSK